MKKRRLLIPVVGIALLLAMGFAYCSDYYHASDEVKGYLSGTETVRISPISEGIFLDGPGDENALIFYPGGKVEHTSYLPLLSRIAAEGTDCFLVKMPANLAVLGKNKASKLISEYQYQRWYLAGHSLGGAVAAMYASEHDLDGLILLAAYPTLTVEERTLELYGSEDRVLNWDKRDAGDQYLPEGSVIEVIEGGNHAQFGHYGPQKGDGKALISREKQQEVTVQRIRAFLHNSSA